MAPFSKPKWTPNRTKIDTKINVNFACILVSFFCGIWKMLGPKMGRPGGPTKGQRTNFFDQKSALDPQAAPRPLIDRLEPLSETPDRPWATGRPKGTPKAPRGPLGDPSSRSIVQTACLRTIALRGRSRGRAGKGWGPGRRHRPSGLSIYMYVYMFIYIYIYNMVNTRPSQAAANTGTNAKTHGEPSRPKNPRPQRSPGE